MLGYQEKRYKLEKLFRKMLREQQIIPHEDWEGVVDFITDKVEISGEKVKSVYIRCQSVINSENQNQCPNKALLGSLLCKEHGGLRNKSLTIKETNKKEAHLKVYSIAQERSFKKELAEIDAMPEEVLTEVNNEVKLGMATILKYLKSHSEEEILRDNKNFFKMIETVVKAKETNYNIKHGAKFSFSKEQVQYVFQRMVTAAMEVVKNTDELQELARRYQAIAEDISMNGFKVIK
jgi:hypothetical protein